MNNQSVLDVSAIFKDFKTAKINFEIKAENDVVLPDYKGSTFRGVFGHIFKDVMCVSHSGDCEECSFDKVCMFKKIFDSSPPSNSIRLRNYSDVPHPYIIEPLLVLNLPFNKKNKPYPIDIHCIIGGENHEVTIKLIKELFNFHYLKHLTASPSISENKNLKVNIAVEITEPISVHHYIDGNKNLNININGEIAKHEFEFLTGGWLERFCFNELYELKEQGIFNDIGINARVRNASKGKEAENEFDVLFTYNNNLYMVECKSLNQGHDSETDILYKISALQADLGRLTTKSFLASTASENIMDKNNPAEIKETLVKRAKLLNCSIIMPSDLINFKEQIKRELRIN